MNKQPDLFPRGKVAVRGPKGSVLPVDGLLNGLKWLRPMIEHEVHHRAQIYLTLGMLGVDTPPLYGLTSEEVRERSAL